MNRLILSAMALTLALSATSFAADEPQVQTPPDQAAQTEQAGSQTQAMTGDGQDKSGQPATRPGRAAQNEAWTSPETAADNQREYQTALQRCDRTDDPQNCVALVKGAFGQL
jgi:hypothetical protein